MSWAVCRDYDVENTALTTLWREAVTAAFDSDQTMIEAQQRAVGSHDIVGHGGQVVAADESGAAARHIIDQLLAAERALAARAA